MNSVKTDNTIEELSSTEMDFDQLEFAVYCIGSVADAIGKDARDVYRLLKSSGILMEYIIPCYDVLHTFGKQYIVEDIVSLMKKKGVIS